jgi:hypothetical protein
MVTSLHEFRFGLETEYIVLDRGRNAALWHNDLTFERLNGLLEKIPLDSIPSLDGLDFEKPHRKMMPYVVEGYHLPDQDFQALDLLPKGIEIRTPVCRSIDECLDVQGLLLARLARELETEGLGALALSHHPDAHHFQGPQNKRRHDFWQWAMEVMTTYGPDINVGVPDELWVRLDQADLLAKINHYGPALTALSVRAPFREGKPWRIRGRIGKSLRVFRRSVVAPPIEVHPHENRRLEFKVFDMTPSFAEMEGYFLLFLTLLLDDKLRGRASQATRIYDSGAVAVEGFKADTVVARLGEIFERAQTTLPAWGFPAWGLGPLIERFDTRRTPADDVLERYRELNESMPRLLQELCAETESACFEVPVQLAHAGS